MAPGRQVIEAYGNGGFRIGGNRYQGSVLVFRHQTVQWDVHALEAITSESLAAVVDQPEPPRILLIGCGPRAISPPVELVVFLRARGIAIEWMDTGAACRTFNVLLSDEREVAAALIAV
jgi:uncharacterized protein